MILGHLGGTKNKDETAQYTLYHKASCPCQEEKIARSTPKTDWIRREMSAYMGQWRRKDLNLDLQIVGVPTIRDPDGIAMSSRNAYLSTDERASARSLKNALDLARDMVGQGERDTERIKKRMSR